MKAADRAALAALMARTRPSWKTGDACQSFQGPGASTVLRVEGEIVYLADGTSGHITKMRTPLKETR